MKILLLIAFALMFSACAHKKHHAHHDHQAEKKDHDCHCSKAEAPKPVAMEFDGACPMGLCRRNQKVTCDPEITLAHKGKNYCFSTLEARETFMKDIEGNLKTANKRWSVMQAAGSR
jgi:hypothetical protein